MRQDRGFTLIELLIVTGIIGVIAALAIPQLLRARLSSQEASAIASVRAISTSVASYAATCGAGGYATDLSDLALPAPGTTFGFISPDLSVNGVRKSGYIFTLSRSGNPDTIDIVTPACNGAASPRSTGFFASGVPITPGTTGTRFFATDTPGSIYEDTAAPIPNPIPPGTRIIQQ